MHNEASRLQELLAEAKNDKSFAVSFLLAQTLSFKLKSTSVLSNFSHIQSFTPSGSVLETFELLKTLKILFVEERKVWRAA